jgi:hypothetical protein
LSIVIDRFVAAADRSGVVPIVIFVPKDLSTYKVSFAFAAAENLRLGRTVAHEFIDDDLDWGRYKLSKVDWCHPSTYGYSRLANFVAGAIQSATEGVPSR